MSDYSSGGWVAATAPYVHNLSTKGEVIHNAYFSLDKTRWVGEQGFIFGDLHVGLMHYFDVYSSTGKAGDPTVAGPKYCYPFP